VWSLLFCTFVPFFLHRTLRSISKYKSWARFIYWFYWSLAAVTQSLLNILRSV
jgi:hypothetical protein